MLFVMKCLALLVISGTLLAQTPPVVPAPPYKLPSSVADRLSSSDRVLFDKLMRVGLEAAWTVVSSEGYLQCYINELHPLSTGRRMVGRARTIRYLPNRKDLHDKIYSQGPQLNYRSAEEALPGDVLVFDAGGETHSTVSGAITTTRFVMRGGSGIMVDKKVPQQSSCDTADGDWHGADVTLRCHYTDGGSGPATQETAARAT